MSQWLETPAIVLAIVAVLTILWKAAVWKGTVDAHRKATDKTLDEHRRTTDKALDEHRRMSEKATDEHRRTTDKALDEHRRMSEKAMDEHRRTLESFMKEIRDHIIRIFERLPPVPVETRSPRQLSDFGEKISARLEAHAWASGLAPKLRSRVEGKEPFEIDLFSREYVRGDELGPEWRRRIAACAYEFGVDASGVLEVLQVVLRNALLKPSDPPA